MYIDHNIEPNYPTSKVVVIEKGDQPYTELFTQSVIDLARSNEATSRDYDGDEIFWIVFADNAGRLWDMTERALRGDLRRPKSERLPKEQLIAMGDSAPIGEILETFEIGNLHGFAKKEMPIVCREHGLVTIGDIAKMSRYEICGSQRLYAGNKTLSYLDAVLQEFGKPALRY